MPLVSRVLRSGLLALLSPFAVILATAGCDHRAQPSPQAAVSTEAPSPAAPNAGTPCGELGCLQFDAPADAVRAVLTKDTRVVAVGEAHAPRGASAPSATKRFTADLLPLFAGRASDLLVELMMPPTGCAAATAEVRTKEAPATSQQAPTNQDEYLALGERARALGIVPDMLRPSCADMDAVRDAAVRVARPHSSPSSESPGDGAIDASLEMIARLSFLQAARLVDRDARSDADAEKVVVVYGGMLHNDLDPTPARAKWSYAPALAARTHGRLVAIDLIVPEFIVDDATWRALPWFSHYDRGRMGAKTTLFQTGARSFVLVFPATPG